MKILAFLLIFAVFMTILMFFYHKKEFKSGLEKPQFDPFYICGYPGCGQKISPTASSLCAFNDINDHFNNQHFCPKHLITHTIEDDKVIFVCPACLRMTENIEI